MLRPRVRENGSDEETVATARPTWPAEGAATAIAEPLRASLDPLFGRTDKYLPLPPAAPAEFTGAFTS